MVMGIDIISLFKSDISMWFLLIASVAGVALIVERLWFYAIWGKQKPAIVEWIARVKQKIANNDTEELIKESHKYKHPSALLVATAIEYINSPEEDLLKMINNAIVKVQMKLESGLNILGTIASIAPLLGLFGTVAGIIRSFRDIAVTGSGGSSVVAMGVAVALVATAIGILIAVPALISYNYFVGYVSRETSWLESTRDNLSIWIKISKGGRK